jgi:membrane-bound metal-dependent hydrolase YbcI (DUF457 family)
MFLAHFALAFAAKPAAPRASLGVLVAAAQFPDLLWPFLLLAGVEQVAIAPGDTAFTPLRFVSYPISHSLLTVLMWALLWAVAYYVTRGDRRGACAVLLLVASHWLLDAVAHRPDLPLSPWSDARVGLGLWNSVQLTLALELLMLGAGAVVYLRSTAPADRTGRFAIWALLALLVLIEFGTLLGPPPPSAETVAWAALALWLVVLWAAWADRHRAPPADIA